MTGALLLIGAGVWLVSQIFAGDLLGRLGIDGPATLPGKKGTA